MTTDEADLFDTLETQLLGMYEEIGTLSKKKPDGAVNKFKLKFINELLGKVNSFLENGYLPFDEFSVFEEDELPTASDIVFVLGQYLKSMDKFRFDNTYGDVMGDIYWLIKGKRSQQETRRSRLMSGQSSLIQSPTRLPAR